MYPMYIYWINNIQSTNTLQVYFTGAGAIRWLPQFQWSNPEDDCPIASEVTLKDIGKINQYQAKTKDNKVQTLFIILYSAVRYKVSHFLPNSHKI